MLETVLSLPAESCATPAGICTDTVPAFGVTVNVYVVPEPERLDFVPPVTLISSSVSSETGSENVAVTVNAAFVVSGAKVVSNTVGATLS